jgi:hypothetical protein
MSFIQNNTGFCLRIHVELTRLGLTDRTSLFLRTTERRQTRLIPWAQLSSYHLKTQTVSSLRNVVFWIKDRTMDDVKNCDSYELALTKLAMN